MRAQNRKLCNNILGIIKTTIVMMKNKNQVVQIAKQIDFIFFNYKSNLSKIILNLH